MNLVTGDPIDLGAISVLVIGMFWMIARGILVTRREFTEMRLSKDKQIDYLTRANDHKDEQIEKLLVGNQVGVQLLEALRNKVGEA